MNRIEELIKEKCPDGVEYKTLGELGEFMGGLTGKTKDDFYDGNAVFITYKNVYSNPSLNIEPSDRVKISEGENQRTLEYGDVIFTGSSETPSECGISSVVTKYPTKKMYLNSFCFIFRFDDISIMEPNFAKHLFRSYDLRYQISKTASGVTRFNVSKDKMKKVTIPVPPIEVQQEIVRILDKFAELEAELQAELDARKKQYEYAMDSLVANRTDVVEISVGEAFDIITDYTAAGSFADLAKNVIYNDLPDYAQLVRTTDIKSKFTKGSSVYVSESAFKYLWRVNLDSEAVILPNIGVNCGEVYYVVPKDLPHANNVLGPNAILARSTKHNNRYLAYTLQTPEFQRQLRKIISPAGQTKFNKTDFKKLKIEVPSIEEQEKVVELLDKFDGLCNDVGQGFPSEIAARHKQYEYYRDKLLTFKRKEV